MPTKLAAYLWNLWLDGDGENVYSDCPDPNCPDSEECDGSDFLYTKWDVTDEDRARFNLSADTVEMRLYGQNYNECFVRIVKRKGEN